MQRSSLPMGVSSLKKWMEEKGCLRGDLPFQRHSGMWSNITQSNLIWSVLADSYIPPIVLLKDKAGVDAKGKDIFVYQILDGLQRLTTLFKFMNGDFVMHSATPEVEVDDTVYDLGGCSFQDLSEECQEAISNYRFTIQCLENYTMEEAEKLFFNINSGVALSTIQKSKSKMGTELITFLNELLRMDFFTQGINITEAQAKREDDLCLLLQGMLLLDDMYNDIDYKSISTGTCLSYAESIRGVYSFEEKNRLQGIVTYLSEAFPRKNKFLRKNNVPIVIVCAHIANLYGIEPSKFYSFINEFANGVFTEYDEASGSGNVKVAKVKMRLEIMFSEMCRYFEMSVAQEHYPFKDCTLRVDIIKKEINEVSADEKESLSDALEERCDMGLKVENTEGATGEDNDKPCLEIDVAVEGEGYDDLIPIHLESYQEGDYN